MELSKIVIQPIAQRSTNAGKRFTMHASASAQNIETQVKQATRKHNFIGNRVNDKIEPKILRTTGNSQFGDSASAT